MDSSVAEHNEVLARPHKSAPPLPSTLSKTEVNERTSSRTTIIFLDHTAMLSGGEIALLHLVRHIDKTRFEPVVVLSSEGPLTEELVRSGIETHVLPLAPSIVHTRKEHLNRHALTRVRDLARIAAYSVRLAVFARRRRARLLHTNSLKADIMGGIAGRIAFVPVLWHVRDRIEDDYLPPKVVRLFRWMGRTVPSYVVANSVATLSTLHLPAGRKNSVVHDGIPVGEPSTQVPAVLPKNANSPRIGIVGRISPWKGQHVFLEAAAQIRAEFPDAKFRIIGGAMFGEQEYENELKSQVEQSDLGHAVEWLGHRSDIPQLIRELDVLVHASTTGEPFGQVVIEGMIEGTPVVATRGGGIPEIIEDGVSGVLVPMNDSAAMTEAILELLRTPEYSRSIGEAGRQRVLSNFSIERTARNIERVYDAMLGR